MAFTWSRKPLFRSRSRESVFCVCFSPDDRIVVCGQFDGSVVGFDTATLNTKFEFNVTPKAERARLPVTCLAFKPVSTRPILLVGCSNGTLERWDVRLVERQSLIVEEGNEIYALNYRSDGHLFATCGQDATVRVYDDSTGAVIKAFPTISEHPANPAAVRLYSVTFHPDVNYLVLAGGWGKTIHQFDIRSDEDKEAAGDATKKDIFGPYLTGDSLSVSGETIFTASHRLDDRLQFWNQDSGEATAQKWPSLNDFLPNCGKLSNDAKGAYIAVGGGGTNMKNAAFVYDRTAGRLPVDAVFDAAVNCCSFAQRENMVAFGDSNGQVHVFASTHK